MAAPPRSNIVQHLRTVTPNQAPAANVLLDGEIAIEQNDPMKIWVGVPASLDATGRKLLYDKSTTGIGGIADVNHDASLAGQGTPTSPLSVVQATQAQLGGAQIATPVEIAAVAPVDTVIISPSGLRTETGLAGTALVTTAKQIVPAINEMYNTIAQVVGILVFAGSYDAATSTGTFNGQGGIPAGSGPLPFSTPTNGGAFLINTTDGPGTGPNEPGTPLHIEDWLVSDGNSWEVLHFHQPSVTAGNIAVVPPVAGGNNVQTALENIWAVAQTALQAIYFTTPTFAGDALSAATALDVAVIDAGSY